MLGSVVSSAVFPSVFPLIPLSEFFATRSRNLPTAKLRLIIIVLALASLYLCASTDEWVVAKPPPGVGGHNRFVATLHYVCFAPLPKTDLSWFLSANRPDEYHFLDINDFPDSFPEFYTSIINPHSVLKCRRYGEALYQDWWLSFGDARGEYPEVLLTNLLWLCTSLIIALVTAVHQTWSHRRARISPLATIRTAYASWIFGIDLIAATLGMSALNAASKLFLPMLRLFGTPKTYPLVQGQSFMFLWLTLALLGCNTLASFFQVVRQSRERICLELHEPSHKPLRKPKSDRNIA